MRTLVLIPAYNEEKNLERVIENLKKKLHSLIISL